MDIKLTTLCFIWFCFIANISVSQSASAKLDSRQRFRRQDDESFACPQGTKACKNDEKLCAIYCDGNTECTDASDEFDCVATTTAASATVSLTSSSTVTITATTTTPVLTTVAATNETNPTTAVIGEEAERADIPADTTEPAEPTLPAIIAIDRPDEETTGAPAGVSDNAETTEAAAAIATTESSATQTQEAETATAVLADGTTIVLPPGTTATISAEKEEATTGEATAAVTAEAATEEAATAAATDEAATTVAAAAATESSGAPEAATSDATAHDEAAASTAAGATVEVSTVESAGNETETLTTVKPSVDETTDNDNATSAGTEAAGEATTVEAETVETVTLPLVTVDSNQTTSSDNETATDAAEVSTVTSGPIAPGTTIDLPGSDDNATSADATEEAVAPTTAQPGPGQRVELRVVVTPEILQVQRGRTYEITCGVYGADASTTIYWIQEEPERRYALIDPAEANDKQVTMSQVSLRARITLDDPSKIGKYTCMAQDAAGNSGAAILTMQESSGYHSGYRPIGPTPGTGSGYLRIVAPDMADGDYVEIQCEGAQPEDEGRIQWFFNNRLLNDEQPLFPRGKTLYIRPISRAYLGNYRCSIPGSSYADGNSVLTFGGSSYGTGFSVSVEIVQGQVADGQAQEGAQVVLRCRTSEQASTYRWTFTANGNQGAADRGYSDQLVIARASAQDSGVYTCEATSTRGQQGRASANLYITRGPYQPSPPISGRCSIDEATCRNGRCIPRAYVCDGKNDCGDNSDESCGRPSDSSGDYCQPNEVRCTNYGRGRKCVQKFWMCDGDRDCDDGSDEDLRYCELLPRQRYCKPSEFHCGGANISTPNPVCIPRSFQCDGYNDCPDRSDEVGCAKPTVVVAPQRQIQINAGQTLTIQCTARGSPAPYINWRLNWGHVCGDGSDNGRCQMIQSIDPSDPGLVTGTLTVLNVNVADAGAYSCEALNNQGFIFAIPDAIVNVIIGDQPAQPSQTCSCNGHSSQCSPDGRCLNCQHNTAGANCEFCAPGYQGDARRGTPYDCQPIPSVTSRCDPSGTHMERGGRCICKYNVEGDRCDQCKRGHFFLNPTSPNGCLPCFCSGVSTDCTSTDWRRQAVSLPLNNWNAVPKNYSTDRYEVGNKIQQRQGGRELAIDQNSLGRSANEVLYWKAPKAALGDLVTLYDGNIDVHFINDGQEDAAPGDDEFIWLRGNNIDIVHKIPQNHRFKPNTNASYSVPVNERTFTRKDGTYIDRENILMALADVDTLLIKINPIGGRRNAVLRGVTLNIAARDGYADSALTVESCRCPANYTGQSCEKCAEGYGRPHPLVGIYLGQCLSCRVLCNDRSDRCDRETGKCFDCQGNSEGDRCERCRPGFVLDARINQCVREGQYQPYPSQPSGETGLRGTYYIDQRPYDGRVLSPVTIVLDGSRAEQRVPLQALNVQPRSVVWGRTDGSPLPANVIQEGNDLVIRNPSVGQGGNYIATITFPDGHVERLAIYLDYRPGQSGQGYAYPAFNPPSPLTIAEGSNQLIQPQGAFYRVQWRRERNQPLPSGIYQNGNALQITGARPDQSGIYYCEVVSGDGTPITIPYEIRVQAGGRHQPVRGGLPRISIEPRVINLKEGQRMIVQYTVSSQDPIRVTWNKLTDQGYQPIPSLFTVGNDSLILHRATPDAAGVYQVVVSNPSGEDRQELRINVEPRRGRGRGQGQGQQTGAPQIRFERDQYELGYGELVDVLPTISGASGSTITWSKDGSTDLPEGVTARSDGAIRIEGRSGQVGGQYTLEVVNAYGRTSRPIYIRWNEASRPQDGYGYQQDASRSYISVKLQSRDEQSHQIGRDIYLQCAVQGSVERPYEYQYTKDGGELENNVEVHPNGLLIIRNAQASNAGRYQCEVSFPRVPEIGSQESSYDLRFDGGYSQQGYDYGSDGQQQAVYVEASIEPSDATVSAGEKANLTCIVKGTEQYTVTWVKYAHDTSLPNYAQQQGNSVLLAPTNESPSEQMYLQCQVNVPGRTEAISAYAPVTIRGGDDLRKKKKKRRS